MRGRWSVTSSGCTTGTPASPRIVTGSLLLALSVFSAIPACVNLSEIAAARVRQHRLGQYGVTLASALITIPAVLVLMPLWGLPGVGVALVAGQGIVAAVVLLRRLRRAQLARG